MDFINILFIIFLIFLIIYYLKDIIRLKSNFKHRVAWRNCKQMKIKIPMEKRKNEEELELEIEKNLKKILDGIHTGAILLIQNNSDPVSIFMRLGITGRFSHSAIILNSEFFKNDEYFKWCENIPTLWQAAGEKITEKFESGPDIHSLSKFLSFYMTRYPDCRYAIRNLRKPLNDQQMSGLKYFITVTKKVNLFNFVSNFEMFWCFYTETLFRFLLPLDPYVRISNKSSLTFCSKLLCETYQYIGLMNPEINGFTTTPNCFSYPNNNNILYNETEIVFIP